MAINTTIISGFVGRIDQPKEIPSGWVMSFSVGVNSNKRNSTGGFDTAWFNVKKFDKNGNYVKRLNELISQGTPVTVSGTLEFDPQTGGPKVYPKKDGSFGASFQLIASEITPMLPKNYQNAPQQERSAQPSAQPQKPKEQELYSVDDDRFNSMDDMPISFY